MANEGMLRGNRDRSNSGIRSNDLRNNRPNNLTQFYDDLGFSATPEAHEQYVEDEAEFQSTVGDYQTKVDDATKEYNNYKSTYDSELAALSKAQSSLPSLNKAVNDSYSAYQKSLIKVQVVGPGDKVQKTYYLPKDSAGGMVGQKGLFTSWDGKYNKEANMMGHTVFGATDNVTGNVMNVMVKGYKNDSLISSLDEASAKMETQYKAEATKSISEELAAATGSFAQQAAQLSENAGVLSGYNDQITTAQGTLDSTVAQREAAWEALSQKYIDRSANMRDILGGLTVESAK